MGARVPRSGILQRVTEEDTEFAVVGHECVAPVLMGFVIRLDSTLISA